MLNFLLNISKYLNLKDVGVLELLFALTLMLAGFNLQEIPLSVLMWVILIIGAIIRKGSIKMKSIKPLTIFIGYWLLHDTILMVIADVNMGRMIAQAIYFLAVPILYPALDYHKLRGALNWVALITMAGLLYQWIIITSGGGVHPLEIPGLEMSKGRLEFLTVRPSSFFMEPAACVAFMICPLAFAIMDKKHIWVGALILSIFLTTSTTGLVLSFIILGASLVGQRTKKGSKIVIIIMGGMLFYALTHFAAFQTGVDKFNSTETESDVRLAQGPYIVGTMHPEEFIFGAAYATAYDYCVSGRAPNVDYLGTVVFMSTFWQMILRYGIIGLILYIMIYIRLFKMSRTAWPLLICLLATLFSDPDMFSNNYCFRLVILLVIAEHEMQEKRNVIIYTKNEIK